MTPNEMSVWSPNRANRRVTLCLNQVPATWLNATWGSAAPVAPPAPPRGRRRDFGLPFRDGARLSETAQGCQRRRKAL